MKISMRAMLVLLMPCACLALLPAPCRADFQVIVNTSQLSPSAGPYYLDFQLNLGGLDTNNTVTLSGFSYGGGSPGSVYAPFTTGNSGNLSNLPVVLSAAPNGYYAELTQAFTPGTALQFYVDMTNFTQTGGNQDTFTFNILDSSLSNIPTTNPNYNNSFLEFDTNNQAPLSYIASASSDPTDYPVGAPAITATPEPASVTLLLVGGGIAGVVGYRRRRLR